MSDAIDAVGKTLLAHGYAVLMLEQAMIPSLIFESGTVLGFAIEFESVRLLAEKWEQTTAVLATQHQMALRRSGIKAWNAYAILITSEQSTDEFRPVLNSIEEDLVGMRKIVRDGVRDVTTASRALLPLIPFLRSPELPPIDMREEIRLRTGGVPADALKAFFSEAPEGVALQVIEEA